MSDWKFYIPLKCRPTDFFEPWLMVKRSPLPSPFLFNGLILHRTRYFNRSDSQIQSFLFNNALHWFCINSLEIHSIVTLKIDRVLSIRMIKFNLNQKDKNPKLLTLKTLLIFPKSTLFLRNPLFLFFLSVLNIIFSFIRSRKLYMKST